MILERNIRYYLFSILSVLTSGILLYYAYGIFGGMLLSVFSLTAPAAFDYLKILFWPLMLWILADRFFFRHNYFENHIFFLAPFLLFMAAALSLCALLPGMWHTTASLVIDIIGVFLFFIGSHLCEIKFRAISIFAQVTSVILCLTLITLFAATALFGLPTDI
ncbi:MAG: hypothetical protein HFE78_02635 [Clostridiales bacterium]|nr:hypothetical protein [Clostridiales bacterium]